MPDLKRGESSRKRERSPKPSAEYAPVDGSERDGKKQKGRKKKSMKRRARKSRERQKRIQAAAAAAHAEGEKSTGHKEPAVATPGTRKRSAGQNRQHPNSLDPLERVKQQVAKGLQRHPNKIKKHVDHTAVEVLSRHAPHKLGAEGYVFVPAGSRYITLNCRRLTLQSGRNVWKIDHPTGKGIQVPKEIYETVVASEAATRTQRSAIVAKIDKKENDEALKCLLRLFPNLPHGASDEILQRAWQKSSGRVGRTKKLTMEQKVRLAVVAHIRHCHTSYEKRLRDEVIKNGGQRAPAKVVQRIKSKIWGEVNAVVKRWQRAGAGERVIPQQNPHRRPAPPKTRWQQNVEQGFVITHPPINRPRPIFIRHEERRKERKTEAKSRQKRPLEVILIESDSEEDTATGADIPEIINLQDDDEIEGGEIMEGNSNDWDAAVGNAQDWDIGEDDEESDVDENCFFYPDEEEDEDYVERERGLGSDADEDDGEKSSDHDMGGQIVQRDSEEGEEEEEEEVEEDDDNIMAESDEPINRNEAFLAKKGGGAVLVKQQNDETVSAPPNLEKAEVATEVDGAIFEPVKVENIFPEDETSIKEPNLENDLVINADEIILDLEDIKAVQDEDEIIKEEDEIMIDSISQIDVQSCPVSRGPEGGDAVEVAKSASREEGNIGSMLEKAARMSKEEEEELRSAVEADEDEIYRDFGF